jgi:tetratricopeptide (TPR) repeat protein
MSSRFAPIVLAAAIGLGGLGGCSTTKPGDLFASRDSEATGTTGTSASAEATASTDPATTSGVGAAAGAGTETTGSVVVQPAEPGPSGEPIAPLAKPGLLGDDPNDDLQRGKRYFRSNNFGLAEQSFRTAAEKHPRDAEAWVGLAASYDRLRRFDLADRAYQEAIRLVGRTPEVLNNLGFSYLLRGDYARAQKIFREALIKDPANPYIQANLRLLEESGREGKAVQ